jgi:hypothetical protein
MLAMLGTPRTGAWRPDGAVLGAPQLGRAVDGRAPAGWSHSALFADAPPEPATREVIRLIADFAPRDLLVAGLAAITPRLGAGRDGPVVRAFVFSNPVEGREEEYNAWYSGTHLHDVLKAPGYLSAQRYKVIALPSAAAPAWRYAAVYEIAPELYEVAVAEVAARSGSWLMPISPAAQRPVSAHYTAFPPTP